MATTTTYIPQPRTTKSPLIPREDAGTIWLKPAGNRGNNLSPSKFAMMVTATAVTSRLTRQRNARGRFPSPLIVSIPSSSAGWLGYQDAALEEGVNRLFVVMKPAGPE